MKTNKQQPKNTENGDFVVLTREEIIDSLEKDAQRRLKMSAEKLVRLYRHGKLDDPGRVADLLALSDLLPDDDPLFGDPPPNNTELLATVRQLTKECMAGTASRSTPSANWLHSFYA